MLVLVVMGWKGAGDSLGGPMYRGGGWHQEEVEERRGDGGGVRVGG